MSTRAPWAIDSTLPEFRKGPAASALSHREVHNRLSFRRRRAPKFSRQMTEVEIRAALISHIVAQPEGADAAFIVEMFVDRFSRRVDLVVANGHLSAFEIKSPLDSLDRLPGQIETYSKHFEQVTVVCADKHVSGVRAAVSKRVGIWRVSGNGEIVVLRKATLSGRRMRSTWLSFLPVDELRALLRAQEMRTSGDRVALVSRCQVLNLDDIRLFVLDFLKRRHIRVESVRARRADPVNMRPSQITSAEARLEEFLRELGRPDHRTATPRTLAKV